MIEKKYVLLSFLIIFLTGTVIRAMDEQQTMDEQQRIQKNLKDKRHRIKKALKEKRRYEKLISFCVLNKNAGECQCQVDRLRTNFGQKPYVTTHMLREAGSLQVALVHLKHRNLTLENELAGAVERAILQHVELRIPAESREKFILNTHEWYNGMLLEEQEDLSKAARDEAKRIAQLNAIKES